MIQTDEKLRVLFVDDEVKLGRVFKKAVNSLSDWEAESVTSGEEALDLIEHSHFHLVISDVCMHEMDGIQLLEQLREISPETGVVMMTAYGTIENAVAAMKKGADDYLIKPVKIEAIKRILENRKSRMNKPVPGSETVEEGTFDSIVAASPEMRKIVKMAQRVAGKDVTVILRGESGTGKDLLAGAIHRSSSRKQGPFVKAVCAAIPEGLLESDLFGHTRGAFTGATEAKPGRFQMADRGTIFLDEIGDMSLNTQVKLLRVIQDREFEPVGSTQTVKVDVRVIAATNRDLEKAIKEGQFREDLYYRLSVVSLHLPPLRERKEDILPLVARFLNESAQRENRPQFALSPEVEEVLLKHRWPGNVRELQNTLQHAEVMATGESIERADLPLYLQSGDVHGEQNDFEEPQDLNGLTLEQMEKELIRQALESSGGNATKAAEILGITRRTLGYRREKYGL